VGSAHRLVVASHVTVPGTLGAPPQQAEVEEQKLLVVRHPVAGTHTAAPVPTSTHVRDAQFSPPIGQGLPSCSQPPLPPPVMNWQKPAPPSLTEQALPQQSLLRPQESPLAWQK
jgi:hypothetical protein